MARLFLMQVLREARQKSALGGKRALAGDVRRGRV